MSQSEVSEVIRGRREVQGYDTFLASVKVSVVRAV
jgi:hypothetical protein